MSVHRPGENQSPLCVPPHILFSFTLDCLWLRKTRAHLDYLHLQILSIITGEQLRRIFERRSNFDLRRLLTGEFLKSGPFGFSNPLRRVGDIPHQHLTAS